MDFKERQILDIRDGTEKFGPFRYSFTRGIPADAVISDVEIKAYAGVHTPVVEVSGLTEIGLIDTTCPPVKDGNDAVLVWFKYPGDDYKGGVTVIFTVTLAESGAVYPFYCHKAKVS